jgi:hypothetical protein
MGAAIRRPEKVCTPWDGTEYFFWQKFGFRNCLTRNKAYREARRRERDVILPDGTTHAGRTPAHWRRVALIVARRTGHVVGLDTATRMLTDRENETEAGEASDDDEIRRLTGQ